MMYGTAHDTLNGHGPGLGYMGPNPSSGASQEIPLSCGIDPNGNAWIKFSNQYFSDNASLWNWLQQNSFDRTTPEGAAYSLMMMAYQGAFVMGGGNLLYLTSGGVPAASMAAIVGQLRRQGVPFTAYQPVAPPTITPTPTPTTVQRAGPALAPNIQIQAPSPAVLISKSGSLTTNDFQATDLSTGQDLSNKVKSASLWQWGGSFILGLDLGDAGGFYFGWAGTGWGRTDRSAFGAVEWSHLFGVSIQPSGAAASQDLTLPPGFKILQSMSDLEPYPLYAQAILNPDGTTTLQGTPFFGLTVPNQLIGGMSSMQYVGLDPTKISAGLYAYEKTDLGPIINSAGRAYELNRFTIYDLVARKTIGPFYGTVEGGGGAHFLEKYAPEILRAVTTAGSGGMTEIIHATDEGLAKKVDLYVGGSSIAAAVAVGATIATGGTGTAAAVAGTIAALTETAEIAAQKQKPEDVIASAIITGVSTGVLTGIAGHISQAANPVADAINGTAFPVAADAGSSTASLILPTTARVAAMNAAGSTLLPASLSLIAPNTAILTAAETITAGATAGTPPPTNTIPPSSIIPTGAKTAAAGLTKVVGAAVASTAATALATEIKKLTGQLPGAKPPSQEQIIVVAGGETPAPSAGPSSKLLTWGLGALAALAVLKKKAS